MSGILSSDILEQQFGETELVILWQDSLSRIICTKAVESGQTLELSWVSFVTNGIAAFPGVHAEIIAGKSMGKAFSKQRIAFERRTRTAVSGDIPANLGSKLGDSSQATIVEVTILVGDEKVPYAEILEIYHPGVTWPEKLGAIDQTLVSKLNSFSSLLQDI